MKDADIDFLRLAAFHAVRNHGIDRDTDNSDSVDDAVHPDVFGDACNSERFAPYEAAEISDVVHEAIADAYWKMVDEANRL